ncbi:MAG: hypothetical protein ABH827_03140 [bacterium]
MKTNLLLLFLLLTLGAGFSFDAQAMRRDKEKRHRYAHGRIWNNNDLRAQYNRIFAKHLHRMHPEERWIGGRWQRRGQWWLSKMAGWNNFSNEDKEKWLSLWNSARRRSHHQHEIHGQKENIKVLDDLCTKIQEITDKKNKDRRGFKGHHRHEFGHHAFGGPGHDKRKPDFDPEKRWNDLPLNQKEQLAKLWTEIQQKWNELPEDDQKEILEEAKHQHGRRHHEPDRREQVLPQQQIQPQPLGALIILTDEEKALLIKIGQSGERHGRMGGGRHQRGPQKEQWWGEFDGLRTKFKKTGWNNLKIDEQKKLLELGKIWHTQRQERFKKHGPRRQGRPEGGQYREHRGGRGKGGRGRGDRWRN